jgi:superfamily II DNA or RNA helicase
LLQSHRVTSGASPTLDIPSDIADDRFEYLVKWRGLSYKHCDWLPPDQIIADMPPNGKRKLVMYYRNFQQQQGVNPQFPAEYFDPQFAKVDRIIAMKAPTPKPSKEEEQRHRWVQGCRQVLSKVMQFKKNGVRFADMFQRPVDPDSDGVPDYLNVVTHPMDLGKVKSKLLSGVKEDQYGSVSDFCADVRLVFSNCRMYNTQEDNGVRVMGDALSTLLEIKQAKWAADEALRTAAAQDTEEQRAVENEGNDAECQFYVKWKGLSYTECTWEKESDIDDDHAVADFYRHQRLTTTTSASKLHSRHDGKAPKYTESPAFKNGHVNKLHPHQIDGLNWLLFSWANNRNCILADEMGLGKTIQSVAFLHHLSTREADFVNRPHLVVAPLSTLDHWRREIEGWTNLNCVVYHDSAGKKGRELLRAHEWFKPSSSSAGKRVPKVGVLVTTYEIAMHDCNELCEVDWGILVVDESQRLKNRLGRLFESLRRLKVGGTLLLSGTPLQNNLTELWTLLNFIEPDKFFDLDAFLGSYGALENAEDVAKLTTVIRPHLLRRLKQDVGLKIPKKEEILIDVELTTFQKQYYRALYDGNRDFLCQGLSNPNAGPGLMNLEMQLRKCCNHPFLLEGCRGRHAASVATKSKDAGGGGEVVAASPLDALVACSGKMVLLSKFFPKLKKEGHKVLVFSQMKRMLDLLEEFCQLMGYKHERIDGSVSGNLRQASIDRFSDPAQDRFVFLLSTKAGGVGINLTAADTVVIFDSDWNPQNDMQAQARCHRIGQTQAVKIFRLVTTRSYEATMFERASRKLGLEQAVFGHGIGTAATTAARGSQDGGSKAPTKAEIEQLLRRGAYGALQDDDQVHMDVYVYSFVPANSPVFNSVFSSLIIITSSVCVMCMRLWFEYQKHVMFSIYIYIYTYIHIYIYTYTCIF